MEVKTLPPRLSSAWVKSNTTPIITDDDIAAGVGKAFNRICLSVCPRSNKKRLELSTPNLVHVYSIAVARHALTQRSKCQDHTVTKTVTVARLLVTHAARALPAWVCMSIRLPML